MQMKKRLALWLIGQALPRASDLRPHTHAALTAVTAGAAYGVLLAIAVAAMLGGLYFYLVGEGLSNGGALAVIGGAAALSAVIAYQIARRAADKAAQVTESLSLFAHNSHNDSLGALMKTLTDHFIDGLTEPSSTGKNTETTVPTSSTAHSTATSSANDKAVHEKGYKTPMNGHANMEGHYHA